MAGAPQRDVDSPLRLQARRSPTLHPWAQVCLLPLLGRGRRGLIHGLNLPHPLAFRYAVVHAQCVRPWVGPYCGSRSAGRSRVSATGGPWSNRPIDWASTAGSETVAMDRSRPSVAGAPDAVDQMIAWGAAGPEVGRGRCGRRLRRRGKLRDALPNSGLRCRRMSDVGRSSSYCRSPNGADGCSACAASCPFHAIAMRKQVAVG